MCFLVEETRYIQLLRKLNISGLDPNYWIFSQLWSLITNFQEVLIDQILKLLLIRWFWISMHRNVIGPSWSSGSLLEVIYSFWGHTLGRCKRLLALANGAGMCDHHSCQELFIILSKQLSFWMSKDEEIIARKPGWTYGNFLRTIKIPFFVVPFITLWKGIQLNIAWLVLLSWSVFPSFFFLLYI